MFKKLKDKKGFTLVELIVVLVILAILAALLVPALTGYIDKAREQSLANEASMVLTAAQATVSEAYGTGDIVISKGAGGKVTGVDWKSDVADSKKTDMQKQINELAEVKKGASWTFNIAATSATDATYNTVKIATLVYSDGTNAIVYSNGEWGSTSKGKTTAAAAQPTDYTELLGGSVSK